MKLTETIMNAGLSDQELNTVLAHFESKYGIAVETVKMTKAERVERYRRASRRVTDRHGGSYDSPLNSDSHRTWVQYNNAYLDLANAIYEPFSIVWDKARAAEIIEEADSVVTAFTYPEDQPVRDED